MSLVARSAFALAGAAIACTMALSASGAESPSTQAGGNPIVVDMQAPVASRGAASSALRQKAVQRGTVRVIVGLRTTLQPPHALSPAAAGGQTRMLRAAQDAVVARVLGTAEAAAGKVARFDYVPFVSLFVNASELGRLLADPDVVNIQEDVPLRPILNQTIPLINANDVWNLGFPGTGTVVAILDSGVAKNHQMFAGGKVVSEACYSTTWGTATTSLCPGGAAASTAANSGRDCPASVAACNHGTAVAGVAAGSAASLKGVARAAKIISIKVASRFNVASDCNPLPAPCARYWVSDYTRGLERVYALRNSFTIAAVNLSLATGQYYTPCDEFASGTVSIVSMLRSVGIATIAATGNDAFSDSIAFPACLSNVIAVGGTTKADAVSGFSNHSPQVRLMAPAANVTTSIPPNAFGTATGTSFATPHVAGAFALLRDARAGATVDDIAAALECTGKPVTRNGVTERRIDVLAAYNRLRAPPNATRTFNFSAAGDASAWKPLLGTWAISGGLYRLTQITPGWKVSSTAVGLCNESLDITAKMRRIDPSALTAGFGAAIIYKAQIEQATKTVSGYFAAFYKTNAGTVLLYRWDKVNVQSDSGLFTLLCRAERTISPNGFNTLKVVTKGGSHQVFINGWRACNVTDHTFGTGRVALATYLPNPAAGHGFLVDQVIIDPTEIVPAAN